ncbi:hypothetical protein ACWCOP_08620 [Maricaulaceae bacterium MS644]
MTEADVIEQMVEYQNILLLGVSVFFTVISAYVVAVWAFLRHAGFGLRAFSFFFLTLVVAFLVRVAYGSQQIFDGFVATLIEIDAAVGLSPTGDAALNNALSGLDEVIQQSMFFAVIIVYIALFFLTFFARSTLKNV